MKERNVLIIVCLAIFALGWCSHGLYETYQQEKFLKGLWVPDAESRVDAIKIAQEFDYNGDWVCINVNGMSFSEMVETCTHESGHEIFAQMVQEDPDIIEKLANYTK